MSGLSSNGRQVTVAVISGAKAASAASSRRLPTQHHGQIASEMTSIARCDVAASERTPGLLTSQPSAPQNGALEDVYHFVLLS